MGYEARHLTPEQREAKRQAQAAQLFARLLALPDQARNQVLATISNQQPPGGGASDRQKVMVAIGMIRPEDVERHRR